MGAGVKVNVEYISANPTGPLHVGQTLGAVFGDALASVQTASQVYEEEIQQAAESGEAA